MKIYLSLFKNFFESSSHDVRVRVDTGPVLNANHSLIYEHAQAIDDLAAFFSGIPHQICCGRVGDDIGHHHL